jgi:hypothetical protein
VAFQMICISSWRESIFPARLYSSGHLIERNPGGPISLIGPSICYGDHEAIGASVHGALYLAGEHHRRQMDTRQRVQLAHFCVRGR